MICLQFPNTQKRTVMCVFWYNIAIQNTNISKFDYNSYQPYLLLDFTFCFEKDIHYDDIHFMFIAQNQRTSHMAFERFIKDDIFYEINKYIEAHTDINTDILCIDGTKYESNANKNTFI